MLKRSRENFDATATTTPHPPSKRLQKHPPGSSPFGPYSSAGSSSSPSVYTPRTPFSIPSDSPSNPFGLKKSLLALDLPKAIIFGKHLALRFQFVQAALPSPEIISRSTKKPKAPIFRVVQVPTNYSFRHLHKLILFLFASDVERHHSARKPTPRAAKGKARAVFKSLGGRRASVTGRAGSSTSAAQGGPTQHESWRGHVFEVHKGKGLVNDSTNTRGIVSKTGRVWRKASSARERHIFRDLYESLDAGPRAEEVEDDEDEDLIWEAEDDFTIGNVWPKGPSLDQGIIYRHNAEVSIHITANTLPISRRKGVGNLPFVFLAQGFAGDTIQISHIIRDQQGEEGPQDEDDDITALPSSSGLPSSLINRWNMHGAFARFLECEDQRERKLRGHISQHLSEDAEPLLDPSFPSSDDIPFCSSDHDTDSESDYSAYSDSVLFPFASNAITPFPAHPAKQKRVKSAERRIATLTKRGMAQLSESDDDDEDDKVREQSIEIPEGSSQAYGHDFNPFEDVDDEVEI